MYCNKRESPATTRMSTAPKQMFSEGIISLDPNCFLVSIADLSNISITAHACKKPNCRQRTELVFFRLLYAAQTFPHFRYTSPYIFHLSSSSGNLPQQQHHRVPSTHTLTIHHINSPNSTTSAPETRINTALHPDSAKPTRVVSFQLYAGKVKWQYISRPGSQSCL